MTSPIQTPMMITEIISIEVADRNANQNGTRFCGVLSKLDICRNRSFSLIGSIDSPLESLYS